MSTHNEKIDDRLRNFVYGCASAFMFFCDFNNCNSVDCDKFIPKLVEAGIVKSEIDFYDCYFKTKNCFDARVLTGGVRFLGIHPENYKFDLDGIIKIDMKYNWTPAT